MQVRWQRPRYVFPARALRHELRTQCIRQFEISPAARPHRVSYNAGLVKHFFSTPLHALREERHFALVEGFAFPTIGSLVIRFRSDVNLDPTMHLFDPQPRS